MKNSSDTSGIERMTFRFVAQHFNHCRNAIPHHEMYGHGNRQIMKQAFELCVVINRTYIQPALSKSPTTKEVSIENVEVLPDKLTEQGIRNSFLSSAQKHTNGNHRHSAIHAQSKPYEGRLHVLCSELLFFYFVLAREYITFNTQTFIHSIYITFKTLLS